MVKFGKDTKSYKHREDLIALLPQGTRKVLDVGCGLGMMGVELKKQGIEIVGIEKNIDAAQEAEKNLSKIIIGDIENIILPFEKGYFDCLIFGDILEHTIDPWKVLKKCKEYLKKGGYCIASIPNVSHYSIIQNLLKNKWEYEDSGLMDRSHLRYFTLTSIRRLFYELGFTIIDIKEHMRTSIAGKILNILAFDNLKYLLVEQYLITAVKSYLC